MPPIIIGVQFSQIGKSYHFDASAFSQIKTGDHVIVETARGRQLGRVTQLIDNPSPTNEGWKPVERLATPRDLVLRQVWVKKELEAMIAARERLTQLHIKGVKIVSAEYSFDGSRLTIMYTTESEEKVDLKSLRHDIQLQRHPSQVDLRQIGPRDVAKLYSGMGACGLETRCCAKFLTEFSPISIKMAKEQGISLTPQEITGMCGRLRCCLVYEYDQYVSARKFLPKRNKIVTTPLGEGKVLDVNPLQMTVRVDLPDIGWREFPRDQVKSKEDLDVIQQKTDRQVNSKPGEE